MTTTQTTIEAYAKLNFTLEVFPERADGYHALRSVVVPVSLGDTVSVEESAGFSSDTGYPDDLCLKAAAALDPDAGVRVSVKKRIPVGGGLGGGSADAAAVLVAINRMRGLSLTPVELAAVGARVGSDVPALVLAQLRRAPVVMEGRGETVSEIDVGALSPLDIVIAVPPVSSSTAAVYAACTPRRPSSGCATGVMVAALMSGDVRRIAAAVCNDLQPTAERLHPEISEAAAALRSAGVDGVTMTGSGSCVFGFARDRLSAEAMAAELLRRGVKALAVRTLVGGRRDGGPQSLI
ncbi:MAG: 4-(cytidine 5'-diphospho)-2-C-methyl-D-erythritol kinase [Kiritimatiellae bacterium]|nr:4-(cytidine 5'-diphospho)-2-C-methyl-D-erythritol kinase [Kiritimatiellia bacterium]